MSVLGQYSEHRRRTYMAAPDTCTLDKTLTLACALGNEDPCSRCHEDREVCKGRPYGMYVTVTLGEPSCRNRRCFTNEADAQAMADKKGGEFRAVACGEHWHVTKDSWERQKAASLTDRNDEWRRDDK